MLDSRTKATGFYRGDAARLVSEAARLPAEPAQLQDPDPIAEVPPAPSAAVAPTPAVTLDEPQRPPLAPQAPTNQNIRAPRPEPVDFDDDEPARWTTGRILAWILLAPWYATIAIAALGVDVLFVKDLFGL